MLANEPTTFSVERMDHCRQSFGARGFCVPFRGVHTVSWSEAVFDVGIGVDNQRWNDGARSMVVYSELNAELI